MASVVISQLAIMASQSGTQIWRRILCFVFITPSHTVCKELMKLKSRLHLGERQTNKVWKAWLTLSNFLPLTVCPLQVGWSRDPAVGLVGKKRLALLTVLPHIHTQCLASLHSHTKVQLKQYQLILQSQLAIKRRTQFPMIASWKKALQPTSYFHLPSYPSAIYGW